MFLGVRGCFGVVQVGTRCVCCANELDVLLQAELVFEDALDRY